MFMVEELAPVMEPGLKLTVTPLGCPLAVNAMEELKPPAASVLIVVPLLKPCDMLIELVAADNAKDGTGAGADG